MRALKTYRNNYLFRRESHKAYILKSSNKGEGGNHLERKEEKGKLRDLLIKATRNTDFREQFLMDPAGVSKKFGVSLTGEQIEKIKETAAFVESLNVLRLPPGPIVYPIDPILIRWKIDEVRRVLRYFVYYPGPEWLLRRGLLRERLIR